MAQVAVLSRSRSGARRASAPLRARVLACALTCVAACVMASGCLLTPRDAEPPQTGQIVVYLEQIAPVNTWDNLETSAEASHAPGWEGAISSTSFLYEPDSAAASQFPGVFTNWNRDREIAFINALYNAKVTIVATMRNLNFVVPPSSGSESLWNGVIYDMTVTSKVDGSKVRYSGRADIKFSLDGNFWYISEWHDLVGESDPDTGQQLSTLGVLRGSFASK